MNTLSTGRKRHYLVQVLPWLPCRVRTLFSVSSRLCIVYHSIHLTLAHEAARSRAEIEATPRSYWYICIVHLLVYVPTHVTFGAALAWSPRLLQYLLLVFVMLFVSSLRGHVELIFSSQPINKSIYLYCTLQSYSCCVQWKWAMTSNTVLPTVYFVIWQLESVLYY